MSLSKKTIKRVKTLLGLRPKESEDRLFNRIEIFGACPASCPFCHSGSEKYRTDRVLTPDSFRRIIEHLGNINLLTSNIYLYDRGEPFHHERIGEILDICRQKSLNAYISTNASKIPKLTRDQWDTIKVIKVSLSGVTDESYYKIYRMDLSKVLANIESIANQVNSQKTKLVINWLRYRFNLEEEKVAKNMFGRLGFRVDAKNATLIQMEKIIAFLENRLLESDSNLLREYLIEDDKRNPFLSRMKRVSLAKHPSGIVCEQWNQIIVNWNGELLKCCGLSPEDPDNRLGTILDLDYPAIRSRKFEINRICGSCISHGIAKPTNSRWKMMWNLAGRKLNDNSAGRDDKPSRT